MANKTRQSSSTSTELYGSSPDSPFLRMKAKKAKKAIGWDDLDADLVLRAAARVTDSGALFSLSKTSEGGALHLFVKNGVDIEEGYFGNVEEASEFMLSLYEAFE